MESRTEGTAGKKHRREAKQFENIKAPEPDDTALFRLDTTSSGAPKYGDPFPYTRGCGKHKSTSESKDNPPQELRCGRVHVSNIGDQGHHQGYPGPAGHGGEGALDPQRKLKQRQGKNPERRDNAAEL